jgi:hypothetical protein
VDKYIKKRNNKWEKAKLKKKTNASRKRENIYIGKGNNKWKKENREKKKEREKKKGDKDDDAGRQYDSCHSKGWKSMIKCNTKGVWGGGQKACHHAMGAEGMPGCQRHAGVPKACRGATCGVPATCD